MVVEPIFRYQEGYTGIRRPECHRQRGQSEFCPLSVTHDRAVTDDSPSGDFGKELSIRSDDICCIYRPSTVHLIIPGTVEQIEEPIPAGGRDISRRAEIGDRR